MILILDTSTILALLLTTKDNNTREIIKLVEKNLLSLAISNETLDELKTKISTPKIKNYRNYRSRIIASFINFYQHKATRYKIEQKIIPPIRDQNDNIFLQLAIVSKADYLITGDKDLLIVKKVGETRIVKPADFLREYKKRAM